ncbi:NEDD4-binding protein 2-like 1 isoform 4-T4 [Morphnus guianensis]
MPRWLALSPAEGQECNHEREEESRKQELKSPYLTAVMLTLHCGLNCRCVPALHLNTAYTCKHGKSLGHLLTPPPPPPASNPPSAEGRDSPPARPHGGGPAPDGRGNPRRLGRARLFPPSGPGLWAAGEGACVEMDERLLRALGGLSLQPPRGRFGGRQVLLLRGLPGAGKSTLARREAGASQEPFGNLLCLSEMAEGFIAAAARTCAPDTQPVGPSVVLFRVSEQLPKGTFLVRWTNRPSQGFGISQLRVPPTLHQKRNIRRHLPLLRQGTHAGITSCHRKAPAVKEAL